MERFFQILAVVLIGIAAFFLWTEKYDAGFVTAVLACLSFLISTRFPVKERVKKRNAKIMQRQIEADKEKREADSSDAETEKVDLNE
ncbi:MAG: hypothetical protein HKN25_08945 [Pyrinomonadaceae bacterium]|nr:hypothetical protein [Pyrinomonadaceae bacterium]